MKTTYPTNPAKSLNDWQEHIHQSKLQAAEDLVQTILVAISYLRTEKPDNQLVADLLTAAITNFNVT